VWREVQHHRPRMLTRSDIAFETSDYLLSVTTTDPGQLS
jgi:hypothetical protein